MKQKIGLSVHAESINEKLFAEYQKAGISHMEILIPASGWSMDEKFCKNMRKWAETYRICLWSCHLPFAGCEALDISSPEEVIRQKTIQWHARIIRQAATIMGIRLFVIHPSTEPIMEEERKIHKEQAKKSLKYLAQETANYQSVIAVEELPRTCLGNCTEEMLELLSADSRLRVCFDTNHLLGENHQYFMNRLAEKIVTTHISDYDFVNERHWLPGEGKIDWQELYASLQRMNYVGPWLYEINFECPKTILRKRNLTCEDFSRNAHEIFNHLPFTILSTPKPELGMWE